MKKFIIILVVLFMFGCEETTKSPIQSSSVMLEPTPYSQVFTKIGTKPMLLEFGSVTCASCVEMGKILHTIKQEHPQSEIYFIDIYKDKEAMQNFKIQMIPTQVYVSSEGFEVDRHIGGIGYDELKAKLKDEKIL